MSESLQERARKVVGYSFWLNEDGTTTAMSYREIIAMLAEMDGEGEAWREYPHKPDIPDDWPWPRRDR